MCVSAAAIDDATQGMFEALVVEFVFSALPPLLCAGLHPGSLQGCIAVHALKMLSSYLISQWLALILIISTSPVKLA